MKIFLAALICFSTLLTSCGGGGGGGENKDETSFFNFFGVWLSSLELQRNSCQIQFQERGNVSFNIDQDNNIVNVRSISQNWIGKAEINSFSSSGSDLPPLTNKRILCPNNELPSMQTSTLDFFDASGNSVQSIKLSYFYTCEDIVDQCELTFTGFGIRTSGAGGASGELVDTPVDQTFAEPLF